jgi:hypothetical protein
MTGLRKLMHTPLLETLLILVIAGLTYLPHLSQATIYRDDWYYTMDRLIGGLGPIINYLASSLFPII